MKRSKKVILTLLIPAVAAFGCSQQPSAPSVRATNSSINGGGALDCDVPAKPGEPAKVPCSTRQGSHAGHGGGGSTIMNGRPITGGSSSSESTSTGSNGSSHSSGTVTRGGFGGTGSHMSGGS